MRRSPSFLVLTLFLSLLVVAGCGDDDGGSVDSSGGSDVAVNDGAVGNDKSVNDGPAGDACAVYCQTLVDKKCGAPITLAKCSDNCKASMATCTSEMTALMQCFNNNGKAVKCVGTQPKPEGCDAESAAVTNCKGDGGMMPKG